MGFERLVLHEKRYDVRHNNYGGELLNLSICMHEEPGGNLFVSEAIYELVELYITVKF